MLIDVAAAGVNYLDIVVRAGFVPAYSALPVRPGFEIAGVVKAVGSEVTRWKPGDTVAALTMGGGGYASQVVAPASALIPVPKGLDPVVAAALPVQGMAALLILEVGNVRPGANVLVSAAAGGVGALAVQIAKLQGANAIGLASPSKHDFVRSNGASHVFDYRSPGWAASVREVVGERGIDLYLDSVGDLQTEAFSLFGVDAHWVVYGVRTESHRPLPSEALWPMVEKNVTLRGFSLEGSAPHFERALAQLFDWTATGRLKVATRRIPLAEAPRAHRELEGRETVGKVLLIP